MHAKKYARISSMQSFISIFLHVQAKIKNEVHSYCIILYMHVNNIIQYEWTPFLKITY